MGRKSKIVLAVASISGVLLFQNCGEVDSQSNPGTPVVVGLPAESYPVVLQLLDSVQIPENTSVYKTLISSDTTSLSISVPGNDLTASSANPAQIQWKLQHQVGEEVALNFLGQHIDLASLGVDIDLFLNGMVTATDATGNPIAVFLIVDEEDYGRLPNDIRPPEAPLVLGLPAPEPSP